MKKVMNLGNQAMDAGRNVFLAGLGVVATVEENYKKTFNQLVEKGKSTKGDVTEKVEEKADNLIVKRVKVLGNKVGENVQAGVGTVVTRLGLPTRKEIQELTKSVELLTEKVSNLQSA